MKSIIPLIGNAIFALLFLGSLQQANEARRNCDKAIAVARDWEAIAVRCGATRDEALKLAKAISKQRDEAIGIAEKAIWPQH